MIARLAPLRSLCLLALTAATPAQIVAADAVKAAGAQCAATRTAAPAVYLAACRKAQAAYDAYIAINPAATTIVAVARADITDNLARAERLAATPARPAPTPPATARDRRLREAVSKGSAYAAGAGVRFEFRTRPDALSDTPRNEAISRQLNAQDAAATIIAACNPSHGLRVTAMLTDDLGRPRLRFPDRAGAALRLRYRHDDDPPKPLTVARTKFANEFVLLDAPRDELAPSWRYLYELDTTHGPVVIKIPLYDPALQQLIQSCAG